MNTTEKGDKFERQIFSIISDLLNDSDFYLNNKTSKIFKKKSYYSEYRKSNITFDLSIESSFKGASEYSMLTIIECKNLSNPVPVDDVEEFDSKLNQIGCHNSKGMIFSRSGFQKSALNLAKSKGIALIRVDDNKELDWINHRKDKKIEEINIDELLNSHHRNNFIATSEEKILTTLPDLLIELEIIDLFKNKSKFIPVPYLKYDQISEKIKASFPDEVYENNVLNDYRICEFITKNYQTKFEFDERLDIDTLGKINLKSGKININPDLKDDIYRWRFTLAHEIGHLFLHQKLLSEYILENIDKEDHLSLSSISTDFNKRLEVQANIFAANLLLPYRSLINDVGQYFVDNDIRKGYLYWDDQSCNQYLVFTLLNRLHLKYKISKEVAKIRLKQLNILKDQNNLSISSIMKDIF